LIAADLQKLFKCGAWDLKSAFVFA